MARLRQKGRSDKWFVDYRDVDGVRYRLNTGTHDKRVADLWLTKVEELLSKARLGIIQKVGRLDADVLAGKEPKGKTGPTLEEFRAIYEDRCRHDLEQAKSTVDLNSLSLRSFKDVVGDKRLDELTDDDVRAWKRRMDSEGKSKTTLSMYHRQLRAAFNRAVKWGFAPGNPFSAVEVAKVRQIEGRKKDMSYDEVRTLLKTIDDAGDTRFATFVRFVLYTGCRRGEILTLRWEDINFDQLSLEVRAQKTSKRLVLPINRAFKRVLDGIARQERGYVFQSQTTLRNAKKKEKPWHEDFASHRFKHYVRAAGLPAHFTLHSLRHTYATYLRQQGVPLDIVQKLLGHASPRTTSENYDHSLALHFRSQADLVDFERE